MRARFIAGEVWSGLRRNLSMALSVVLVTMVSMFLLGMGLLAQRQADTMKGYWYDRIQVSIYLCNDKATAPNCQGKAATDAEQQAIRTQLEAMPEVKEVFHETEQQAYDRFKEQFRNSPVTGNVRVGDIPQSFRVQLDDPSKFPIVTSQFEAAPGVASVQDQEQVLERFFKIINWITAFSVALAALMVVCATLLMATTIRQAAFIRRREIGIMRLVGASNATIRMPFILEMLVVATLGVALAIFLLWLGLRFIFNRGFNTVLSSALIGSGDVWALTPWLVGGVIVIAVLTSLFTLRRYLRV